MSWWARLLRRKEQEVHLDKELRFHIEQRVADLTRSGLGEQEARRKVRQEFGGMDQVKEDCRDARGTRWIEDFGQDARYAGRQLIKNKVFAAVAILILAIGIGGLTAMSSVVKGILLNPLPFPAGERMAVLQQSAPQYGLDRYSLTEFNYVFYRDNNRVFEQFAAYDASEATLAHRGGAERVQGAEVSHNFFSVLGATPFLGRWFMPQEDRPGSGRVVVLSYGLWQRLFGGSRDVIGSNIRVNGEAALVAGVAAPWFQFPAAAQIWWPARIDPTKTNGYYLKGLGRLRPGIGLSDAKANTDEVVRQMALSRPDVFRSGADFTTIVTPLRDIIVGDFKKPLWILFAAASLLLLITCFNVASLLAARATARVREIALRTALGASRRRVARQLLTESLVLAALGALAGTLLAAMSLKSLVITLPVTLPRVAEIRLDLGVLGFTLLAAVAAALVFGTFPVLRGIKSDVQIVLKGAATNFSRRSRLQLNSVFVVLQFALSMVLLMGAGLLVRSLWNVLSVDPGFRTENVLTFRVMPLGPRYSERGKIVRFYEELERRIREIPGVQYVGGSSLIPLAGGDWQDNYQIEGQGEASGPKRVIDIRTASPGYFEAMGFRLLQGRTFRDTDGADAPKVAVIDESLAVRHWPAKNALGKRIKVAEGWFEIIGVVVTVHHAGFDTDPSGQAYIPHAQALNPYLSIAVHATVNPASLIAPIRALVAGIDRDVPVYEIQTMEQLAAAALGRRRFVLLLLGFFAVMALGLSAIGLYGVMTEVVTRRVKEIGIRVAVGASPGEIMRLILRRGLGLSIAGVALGSAGALAASYLVASQLYAVSTHDLSTLSTVIATLVVTGFTATLIPTLNAIRVDPLQALRNE
jgi:putative ABC transport system permease protein